MIKDSRDPKSKIFAPRVEHMRSSEIRELLSILQQDVISFAGGAPDPHTFPNIENFQEAVEYALANYEKAFQYGTTEGLSSFRKQISAFMLRQMNVKIDPNNILVTVGSQEALDIIGRVFLDYRSRLVVELPTYIAALQTFNIWSPKYIAVPTDDMGLNVDVLEERLRRIYDGGKRIKFVYTIPTGHNPLGTVMPLERRKHLLELADQHDFYIVEDDPYGFINYENVPPRLITLDGGDRVIYVSTFSKLFAPGFRLGWVTGPKEIINTLLLAKQAVTLCPPPFNQFVVEYFLRNRWIDKNIPKIREVYRAKRDAMVEAIIHYMPRQVKWIKPKAGFFVFMYLPEYVDTKHLLYKAIEKVKVAYVPGAGFYVDGKGRNTVRLSFSLPTPETIKEGIKRLGLFFDEHIHVESHSVKEIEKEEVVE